MKKFRFLLLLAVMSVFAVACDKDYNDDPFITFRDASGNTITGEGQIPVALNSTYRLFVEAGFPRYRENGLDFDRKIDAGDFVPYTVADGLEITGIGYRNNLNLARATMDISFSAQDVSVGSLVTIRISDIAYLERSLTFVVQ